MGDKQAWKWIAGGFAAAVLLLLVAAGLFAVGFEPAFLPFVGCLIAGVLIAMCVVSLIGQIPGWKGWVIHLALAVCLSALTWWVVASDAMTALPEGLTPLVYPFMLAAGPCIGWIGLTLLTRVTSRVHVKADQKVGAQWQHEARRATLMFPAIEMTLASLAWWIIVTVLIGGVGMAAIVIWAGERGVLVGPRVMLVGLGVLFGIPAYLILVTVLRRRQQEYTVVFGQDRITVIAQDESREFRYAVITELAWGGNGEYSRLRIKEREGERFEIVAGLAKVDKGMTPELPKLPRAVDTRLQLAGLERKPGGRVSKPMSPAIYIPAPGRAETDSTHHVAPGRGFRRNI